MPDLSRKSPHQPRKTPRQARSGATVDAIVEAAARILETGGFDAYTTNAVAKLAGVSIGSLYQYFPTKEAITVRLIARETDALSRKIAEIDTTIGGRAPLEQLVRVAVEQQFRRPALARLLDIEEQRLPWTGETRTGPNQLSKIVRNCIAAAGHNDIDQHPEMVGDIIAIIKGMVDAAGRRGEQDHHALLARVNRAVFGYLSAPE